MYQFIKPDFKVINDHKNKNNLQFQIQPLAQGFGTTLGNSLRRVLLSVLPGTAVFAFKLSNAEQEFQTLPGLHENALQIGLNVEKIIFRANPVLFEKDNYLKLTLKIKPETKTIYAGDIEAISGLTIINPSLILATVVENNKPLEFNFLIRKGCGYATFEENQRFLAKQKAATIGFIAINSQFSPIRRVNFRAQEIRVGEETVSEKLTIGIETNGALTANDCFGQACKILLHHLQHLADLNAGYDDFQFEEPVIENEEEKEVLLQELDFSERTINALHNHNVQTLAELQALTKKQILEIKNLGQKSLKEIEEKLKTEYNITL